MRIIGREHELDTLKRCLQSGRPEFLVVYGRRRVGKTYLIREYFNRQFSFYATGVASAKTGEQLRAFNQSLIEYGSSVRTTPKDWFEALSRLRSILENPAVRRDLVSGRRIVFLDELPWMDTARSDFKSALDYFWNSWASAQPDLMLIACGSATSWIVEHILNDRGGFYNRITCQIHLLPFTLKECEQLYRDNGIVMNRRQMIESYMIFGGIPYYLNALDRRMSLAQNVDALCFRENGQFRYEYSLLLRSLFRQPEKHELVIRTLARRKSGMTRAELAAVPNMGNGESLTKTLRELEQCGFIRRFTSFTTAKQGAFFQVIDPFTLFSLQFLQDRNEASWLSRVNTPGYYAWCGNAFEIVCLNHIPQLKAALGVSGVESAEYAWRSKNTGDSSGGQIDLLIDRRDDVINVCEMKFTQAPFTVEADYEKLLLGRTERFRMETNTAKALHLTLVCAQGIKENEYSSVFQVCLDGKILFQ